MNNISKVCLQFWIQERNEKQKQKYISYIQKSINLQSKIIFLLKNNVVVGFSKTTLNATNHV